nr:unnamed protein product [Callosobruchus analis]
MCQLIFESPLEFLSARCKISGSKLTLQGQDTYIDCVAVKTWRTKGCNTGSNGDVAVEENDGEKLDRKKTIHTDRGLKRQTSN